jgi:dimethylhistidine N-methyltransferase
MKRVLLEKINTRFILYRLSSIKVESSFMIDVGMGLSAAQKYIHPKYFYDETGSELFEKICTTPEYYVTRTEADIIAQNAEKIRDDNKYKSLIVELGSGTSAKTKMILKAFHDKTEFLKYIPVDVSEIIIDSSTALLNEFQNLSIDAILSEYEDGLKMVKEIDPQPSLFLFLGSSIGNFGFDEGIEFIKFISTCLQERDNLLIGFDMVKNKNVLNRAYNDEAGITAQFNLNLLNRINYQLGGQFDLSCFKHHAFFNEKESRIEMQLVSKENQFVFIKELNREFNFKKGETIHTENSYKFTDDMIQNIAEKANLKIRQKFTDERKYFSLVEFELV